MPTKVGSEFLVNTYTTGMQRQSSVTGLTNGNFVVTWYSDGQDGSLYGVYGQLYTAAGAKSGAEFLVNTYTVSSQWYPSVTGLTNGNFVVTWASYDQDGSDFGVYGQVYTAAGAKSGTEFFVNTYTTGAQSAPSVTSLTNGNFVVTWDSDGQDGSAYGVYGQLFTAAGAKIGAEFSVNTYTTSFQTTPSVTGLTNGSFVVTWQSRGQDGAGFGVYGQRFTAAGAKSGAEFSVNTYTTDDQYYSSLTGLTNGNFVVTWYSNNQDGSGFGVYGQRFTAGGNKSGAEFLVNTYTTGDQKTPSVTGLTNGNFVVTWTSNGLDGSTFGVLGQVFTASGAKTGAEFLVNTYTTSDQANPSVTGLTNGNFLATWDSYSQDGSSDGIYGQLFHPLSATNTNQLANYTEGSSYNFSDIVISGSPSVNTTLTLSNPSAGSLSTATSGSVTSTFISNTGIWQASGAVDDVNTLLAGLQFMPATNFNGNFTIAVAIQDGSFILNDTMTLKGIPLTVTTSIAPSQTSSLASRTTTSATGIASFTSASTTPSISSSPLSSTTGVSAISPSVVSSSPGSSLSNTLTASSSVALLASPTLSPLSSTTGVSAISPSVVLSSPGSSSSRELMSSSSVALLASSTLATVSSTIVTGGNSPDNDGGGSSLGIIAGVVVGLLSMMGLGMLALFYRRRHHKSAAVLRHTGESLPMTSVDDLLRSTSVDPEDGGVYAVATQAGRPATMAYDDVATLSPLYAATTTAKSTPAVREATTFLSAVETLDLERLTDYLKRLTEYGLQARTEKVFNNQMGNRITQVGTLVDAWLAAEVAKRDDVVITKQAAVEIRLQQKLTGKQFIKIEPAVGKLIQLIQSQANDYAKPSFYATKAEAQQGQQKIHQQLAALEGLLDHLNAANMKILNDRQSELLPEDPAEIALAL